MKSHARGVRRAERKLRAVRPISGTMMCIIYGVFLVYSHRYADCKMSLDAAFSGSTSVLVRVSSSLGAIALNFEGGTGVSAAPSVQ